MSLTAERIRRIPGLQGITTMACMFTTMLLLEWANPVDFNDLWAQVCWGAGRSGAGCWLGYHAIADKFDTGDGDPADQAKRKKAAKTARVLIAAIAVAAAINTLA